jgi:hypothetical protein
VIQYVKSINITERNLWKCWLHSRCWKV